MKIFYKQLGTDLEVIMKTAKQTKKDNEDWMIGQRKSVKDFLSVWSTDKQVGKVWFFFFVCLVFFGGRHNEIGSFWRNSEKEIHFSHCWFVFFLRVEGRLAI